jgi:hypothetical protein
MRSSLARGVDADARAWFDAREDAIPRDATVRVAPGRATFDAFMDAVRAMAAADAAAATRRGIDASARAREAGVGTEGMVVTRSASAQAATACEACERRERELRAVKTALRECRQTLREKGTTRGIACVVRSRPGGGVRAVEVARAAVAGSTRSTRVNDVVADEDREDKVPIASVTREKTTAEMSVTRAQQRHARRTMVLAKRSRERRAARAAAISGGGSPEAPRRAGKPQWNDSVDINATPRRKTDKEYFAELHKLVEAKEAAEAKERLRQLQKKRRRRRAREAAAVKIRCEKSAKDPERDPQSRKLSMQITSRVPRSSMDSSSSFQSAIEGACADVRDLAIA